MYLQTNIERRQAQRIQELEARVSILEKENASLKAALTGQTIEAERSYHDNIEKFDQLSQQVLVVVTYLVKLYKRPASYHEIIRAFQVRHPNIAKEETITRRVRELVENKWLSTPERGYFVPVANEST